MLPNTTGPCPHCGANTVFAPLGHNIEFKFAVASRQVVYRLAPSGDCYADFFIASMMRLVSLGSTSFTVGTSNVM